MNFHFVVKHMSKNICIYLHEECVLNCKQNVLVLETPEPNNLNRYGPILVIVSASIVQNKITPNAFRKER